MVMGLINVTCDAENELPVPSDWRITLENIAQAFNSPSPSIALGDMENVIVGDRVVDISLGQIGDYPAERVFVGPKTWKHSVYWWQEGYWDVLVDLHIDDDLEEVSDLVLPVKVTLIDGSTFFAPNFIHVP